VLSLFCAPFSVGCLSLGVRSGLILLGLCAKEVAASPARTDARIVWAPATCFGSNVAPGDAVTVGAMDINQHALAALHDITTTDQPFNMQSAVVFLLDHNDQRTIITEYPDVYVALETVGAEVARIDQAIAGNPLLGARALGVLTCGWAAPVGGDETPPSCHPGRRRVRLAVIATTDLVTGSVIEFQDTPNEPIFDDGSGSGSLRDALLDAVRAIVAYQTEAEERLCDD